MDMIIKNIHPDLIFAQQHLYKSLNLVCDNIVLDKESQEYGACTFELNNQVIKFRVAKITPTKIGQFVTIWRRNSAGITAPYDINDSFDFLIVNTRNALHNGQFVFPKKILLVQGIISKNGVGGKRGIRVYPPWDITDNSQAKKTQAWQLNYFVSIEPMSDIQKFKQLLNMMNP